MWLNGRCYRTEHSCPMSDEIQMKTQKGGRGAEGDRKEETERKKRELLKTKDLIQIPLDLIGVVFMLLSECKHRVKTLTLESNKLAWSQCKLLA